MFQASIPPPLLHLLHLFSVLDRVTADVTTRLSHLDAHSEELDAVERLRVLHDFYRTGEESEYRLDLRDLMGKGHSFKDAICPDSLEFKKDHFVMGNKFGRVLFLKEYASYIKDSMINELTALNRNLDYFYGNETGQFRFYRIPKALFDGDLSLEAATLYSLMLDRVGLSVKNGWMDSLEGNIVIDVFPNDTLAGGNSTKGIEYIATGGSDLGAYATSVLANLEPKMSVATIPWSFTSYQQAREVIDGTGGDYYAQLLEPKGITYLGSFHNGFRQLTNSKHAVTKPEDLKGLKIRVPGSAVYMNVFNALGANPTAMSWSEVFTAIQQGTIDGQENGCSITKSAKGGMAIVCVVVSCFFAAISGSGPATVAALGLIMIPALVKAGYPAAFSCALMAAGGAIGVVIPPSITFVVYGSIADASITNLFIAGMLPGLCMGAALIVASLVLGRRLDLKVMPKASGKERWQAFKDAFWGLLMPVIILGGIYGGIFTPTEAAAVSVFYGLIVGIFVYKEIDFKKTIDILVDSCSTTATVMFITMGATLFAYVLTRARLDQAIEQFMLQVTGGNWIVFFLIVNIVLLIAGCFLDSTSALYIFTPLFAPVAVQLGIHPIHLGVVMIVNLAIGLFTPPVGVNLYVACGIGNIKIEEISKGIIPCLLAELVVLLLVTYIPSISLLFVGA